MEGLKSELEICRAEDYAPDPQGQGQPVRLPSGKVFRLRYPSLAFRIDRLLVAQSVAAMLQGREPEAQQEPEAPLDESRGGLKAPARQLDRQYHPEEEGAGTANGPEPEGKALARSYYEVLCEVCVHPKVSLVPQAGELHPERIKLIDAIFIVRWAGGELTSDESDLASFRPKEPETIAVDGAGGADVRPVAEQPVKDVAVGTAV